MSYSIFQRTLHLPVVRSLRSRDDSSYQLLQLLSKTILVQQGSLHYYIHKYAKFLLPHHKDASHLHDKQEQEDQAPLYPLYLSPFQEKLQYFLSYLCQSAFLSSDHNIHNSIELENQPSELDTHRKSPYLSYHQPIAYIRQQLVSKHKPFRQGQYHAQSGNQHQQINHDGEHFFLSMLDGNKHSPRPHFLQFRRFHYPYHRKHQQYTLALSHCKQPNRVHQGCVLHHQG